MSAGLHDFEVIQGDTWRQVITVTATGADVTAATAIRLHVKGNHEKTSTLIALSLGSGITADSTTQLTALASAGVMANVPTGRHEYDLEFENLFGNGDTKTILRGKFTVKPQISQ